MANLQLSDAQRVILAAAGARDTGLVLPLPKSLGDNRGTHGIILKSLLSRELVAERQLKAGELIWRVSEASERLTLVINDAGLKAVGIEPQDATQPGQRDIHPANLLDTATTDPETAPQAETDARPGNMRKTCSKLDRMIAALRRPGGATIRELTEATGWQAHSVRGAISGNLKKKLKLEVASDVVEGRGRVYRIAEVAAK